MQVGYGDRGRAIQSRVAVHVDHMAGGIEQRERAQNRTELRTEACRIAVRDRETMEEDAAGTRGAPQGLEIDPFGDEVVIILQTDHGGDMVLRRQPRQILWPRILTDAQACRDGAQSGMRTVAAHRLRRPSPHVIHTRTHEASCASSITSSPRRPMIAIIPSCASGPPTTNLMCVASAGNWCSAGSMQTHRPSQISHQAW